MSLIIPANSAVSGGYNVDNSFLSLEAGQGQRTANSSANTKTFTYSFWFKRGTGRICFVSFFQSNRVQFNIGVDADDFFDVTFKTGSRTTFGFTSTAVLRDASSWYHAIVAIDTTQATESNRVKVYLNGILQTDVNEYAYPSQNDDIDVLASTSSDDAYIFVNARNGLSAHFQGNIAEFVRLDGTAADATSFGEFDEDSGIWKPIDVSGLTFGTDGFYLDFKDSSNLGKDVSGVGDWSISTNYFSSGYQSIDTCTNNFVTANPVDSTLDRTVTFTYANTVIESGSGTANGASCRGTIGFSNGKWYWENKYRSNSVTNGVSVGAKDSWTGIINTEVQLVSPEIQAAQSSNSVMFNQNGGEVKKNGSTIATYSGALEDIFGFAFDLDNGTLKMHKNGVYFNSGNSIVTGITADTYLPYFGMLIAPTTDVGAAQQRLNFGNSSFEIVSGNTDGNGYGNFEYAVPSGYLSLCTKNLLKVLG